MSFSDYLVDVFTSTLQNSPRLIPSQNLILVVIKFSGDKI